jgi:DNA invertase Pin-like site-specific DNA recombinase
MKSNFHKEHAGQKRRRLGSKANISPARAAYHPGEMPNRLTIHILAAAAEHEAVMISSRTKAALAAAKARGTRLGNPTSQIGCRASEGAQASIAVRKAKAAKRSADLVPILREIQTDGAESLRQIARVLNDRGIPTARGKEWSAVQVQRARTRT